MPCIGINILFQLQSYLKHTSSFQKVSLDMFATFPVHIFLLVKGKYDGFVCGNVQVVSIENAYFQL